MQAEVADVSEAGSQKRPHKGCCERWGEGGGPILEGVNLWLL